jgi:hypothetical protein
VLLWPRLLLPRHPDRGDLGDGGDVLDVQARTAYKQRLHELQAELQAAQDTNDLGRQTLVQEEIEMLLQQLSAAVGLGGRSRHAASPAERARINVTNGIRMALTKMASHSPLLAQYLTTTIKTRPDMLLHATAPCPYPLNFDDSSTPGGSLEPRTPRPTQVLHVAPTTPGWRPPLDQPGPCCATSPRGTPGALAVFPWPLQ